MDAWKWLAVDVQSFDGAIYSRTRRSILSAPPEYMSAPLHSPTSTLLGRRGARDDLDQLASNDGLACAVEQDLEAVDHVASVCTCGQLS